MTETTVKDIIKPKVTAKVTTKETPKKKVIRKKKKQQYKKAHFEIYTTDMELLKAQLSTGLETLFSMGDKVIDIKIDYKLYQKNNHSLFCDYKVKI